MCYNNSAISIANGGKRKIMRSNAGSIFFKYLIALCALGGVTLSLICYKNDGYSFALSRLMYFTGQSNLWIGFCQLILATFLLLKKLGVRDWVKPWIYILKYLFTVSITLTCLIYCIVLAPFADDSYNIWSLGSILTHLAVPILSVIDYFLDDYTDILKKRHIFYTTFPPVAYIIFASVLCVLKVDFGRGEAYPYFFLNFYSDSGIFGVSMNPPNYIGTFYWIAIFTGIVLLFASAYYFLHPSRLKNRKNKN